MVYYLSEYIYIYINFCAPTAPLRRSRYPGVPVERGVTFDWKGRRQLFIQQFIVRLRISVDDWWLTTMISKSFFPAKTYSDLITSIYLRSPAMLVKVTIY